MIIFEKMSNKIVQFMMNKKVWPILLIIVFGGVFWAFTDKGGGQKELTRQQQLLNQVAFLLSDKHFSPKQFDDNFSKSIFRKYLKELDGDKIVFLQSDINALKKYETFIDDEIKGADIKFFPAVEAIYTKRMNEVVAINKAVLSSPLDFTVQETYVVENDAANFPSSETERKDRIRKRLKYLVLERYADLLSARDKSTDEKEKKKTDADLEAEARSKVQQVVDRYYARLTKRESSDDRFNNYVNLIAETGGDAHTNYLPPLEKRAFDEQMSGNFFGIGAQLREEEGNIKIVSVVAGSPAWKSGQVQANDIILKVAQGAKEPVDLSGFAVDEAVKLIRGDKGTEVRLTLKKSDGSTVVVPLVRDKIVTDEIFARSTIITEAGKKIGYIYLPEFYADFENANGPHCAADVAKEIIKLKAENIDGIILDLRNNGGGSLYEVVQMVGLFIPEGPVVQVKDKEGNPSVLKDNDKAVLYDGPLTVMVNEFSASASEIFAAAIQDYNRGIVLGSSSTYGKGTVQRNFPFGKPLDFFSGRTEFGALKITQQKFYRINGGSTQLKGVSPDVLLPDVFEYIKLREKDNEDALKWDQIQSSSYTVWNPAYDAKKIKSLAAERINQDSVFSLIRQNAEWLDKNVDKKYSLKFDKYMSEQKIIKEKVKQNERLLKLAQPMDVSFIDVDKTKYSDNPDKAKAERYTQWLDLVKTDIYIAATAKVMTDMIHYSGNTVKSN